MSASLGHIAFDAVDRSTGQPVPNRHTWHDVERHLDACDAGGWPHLSNVAGIIDGTYPVIDWVLSALP